MSDRIQDDRRSPPVFAEERERLAETWLMEANQLHGGPVDVPMLLEVAGIRLIEWPIDKMGDNEALARPQVRTILGRPRFVTSVKKREPAAFVKLAHEFAHCVLNNGPDAKPLKAAGNAKLQWISESESEENQAWQLARALTLPRRFIRNEDSAVGLATRFQVPIEQAQLRLSEIQLERRKSLQTTPTLLPPELPDAAARMWRRAAIDENHDPEWYRLSSGNYLVSISGYNRRDHRLGWYIYCGRIYANDEWDQW